MSVILPNYSARDSAITQRPTSTAIMAIDSEDRYKDFTEARLLPADVRSLNATPYDFTIQKSQPIINGGFTRIGVSEVSFQYTVPNINPKTNRILMSYQVGAGPIVPPQVITLPPGFYTPSQIASALQALIRAVDVPNLGAFTMVYGVGGTTGTAPLFSYATNAVGVNIAFFPVRVSDGYTFGPQSKQLFDLLGFFGPTNTGNSALVPVNNGAPTFCQSTRYIDIVCTQLTAVQAVKDAMSQPVSRDILCRLYLASPSDPINVSPTSSTFCPPGCAPFTLYRDFSTPKQIQWMPNFPFGGYLQFQVYDDNGDILWLSDPASGKNCTNWSMTMLATEN